MKLGRWSTTAASNNSTPPDGWPEGQAPSTVNDCAREMMASIRTAFQDLQFIDQDFTPTFATATSFTIPTNQTSAIQIGRRLKLFDATAGVATTIYATVVSVSFTAVTTVHITADDATANLTSSLSSFAVSILSPLNNAHPRGITFSMSHLAAGSAFINGTLSVSGAATLAAGLSVSGTTVVNGTLFTTALDVSQAAALRGAVNMLSTLSVSGAAKLNTTLTVSGAAAFLDAVQVQGTLTASGAVTLHSTLSVSGATVLKSTLSVGGAVALGTSLTVSGAAVLGSLTFNGPYSQNLSGASTTIGTIDLSANSNGSIVFRDGGTEVMRLRFLRATNNFEFLVSANTQSVFSFGTAGSVVATDFRVAGALTASGTVVMQGGLSVSGSVNSQQVARAWVRFNVTTTAATTPVIISSSNIANVSRSASGVYRITFANAFADAVYMWNAGIPAANHFVNSVSAIAGSFKFTYVNSAVSGTDVPATGVNFSFFR